MTAPFPQRKRGIVGTIVDIGKGAIVLGEFIRDLVKREPPKRASEIFAHPLESERLRDAAGMTMVGEPERTDTP